MSSRSNARRRWAAALVAVTLVGVGIVATDPGAPEARALSGSEFEAGNIISDELFYDAAAMTQVEIQAFLNAQIGACNNGQCLNVLTVGVAGRGEVYSTNTGNLVCRAFEGGTLSAAAIIYRVQVACGISAKVILVTLQKEQGLVTSRAPGQAALDRAMGMACPDTAPCAPYALGFGNQLYEGAKQLKMYKAGNFARQPGVQSVAYHPNSACGASTVNVQNYATAALYNYTPYQPNAAALANLGTVGDSCSSYGNRNFWTFYSNWFGPTTGNAIGSTDTAAQVVTRSADGNLWVHQGNGRGGWRTAAQIGYGWGGFTAIFGAGDIDGDGHRDIVARDAAGVLWLYPTDGATGWLATRQISAGWQSMTAIFTAGDFNGDGTQDLIARDAGGFLFLHPGLGRGAFGAPVQIGNGWGSMTAIFGAGDFSGDGFQDIIGRHPNGDLWLYRGNGRGGWLAASKIGNGWNGMTALTSPGDFNGDGNVDVFSRDEGGMLWVHTGNGRGGWLTPSRVGVGWAGMSIISGPGSPAGKKYADQPGVGDLDGDGSRDVLAMSAAGELLVYPGNGASGWSAYEPKKVTGAWPAANTSIPVGDFNRDGSRDVISRDASGVLWLYSNSGSASFAPPVQVGSGWGGLDLIPGVGDTDNDGNPDVLARDSAGVLWLYPGNGSGGWLPRRQVGQGWGGMSAIFGAGDFNGDGTQDLLARTTSGDLWLYPGNGMGGWFAQTQVGYGWGGMSILFSPGDFSGDGHTDVIARHVSGSLTLYRGDGKGGWLSSIQIGYGWNGMVDLD